MKIEIIPVFEESLYRSKVVVHMYQQLPHLNSPKVEGPISSNMFGFSDTVSGLNLVNLHYNQSVI